jgi:hypothetical protein
VVQVTGEGAAVRDLGRLRADELRHRREQRLVDILPRTLVLVVEVARDGARLSACCLGILHSTGQVQVRAPRITSSCSHTRGHADAHAHIRVHSYRISGVGCRQTSRHLSSWSHRFTEVTQVSQTCFEAACKWATVASSTSMCQVPCRAGSSARSALG